VTQDRRLPGESAAAPARHRWEARSRSRYCQRHALVGRFSLLRLVIEPAPADYRRFATRYEGLAKCLGDAGWDASVVVSASERRSAVAELVVRMLDPADAATLDALIATLAANVSEALPRLPQLRGRVVIYGLTGDVLRIVEVTEAAAKPE
jgi:hypothetical protein